MSKRRELTSATIAFRAVSHNRSVTSQDFVASQRPFSKEQWRGREREADRENDGQSVQRNGQGNHYLRPRHWHTTATDGGDWCTACQDGDPTTPPRVREPKTEEEAP